MGRRARRREEAAQGELADLAELASVRLSTRDLPPDPLDALSARARRIRTAHAFVDVLYDLRLAAANEGSLAPGPLAGLITYGTGLADDGLLYRAAHPRLPIELHALLEQLEAVWATLQPSGRRVLNLGREHTHEGICSILQTEGLRNGHGDLVTLRWVRARIEEAHATIEGHPVFRELSGSTR